MRSIFIICIALWVCPFSAAQNSSASSTCSLMNWSVYTYQNFHLIDSINIEQGNCNGVQYQNVEGLYRQYAWEDQLLTIYEESKTATLVYVTPAPQQLKTVKIKKKNRLSDSVLTQWAALGKDKTVFGYTSTTKGKHRIITYSVGEKKMTVKVRIKTGQVEEMIAVEKIKNRGGGNDIKRTVTRLNSQKTDSKIVGLIIDPTQVINLKTKALNQPQLDQGIRLYIL